MFKIAKQIRISAKLDKSGFQKELNQLLKKGYDLNLNGGNFKSVVNDISKELNKLKSTLNNVNGNTFDNTVSGVNKTKDAVKDLNSELTRMSSKNLSSTSIIADKNGLSEINKYKDGIAQTTSEVIKNGQVTKQVITENISQFNNLKNQLQNKLLTAKSNNLIDSTVIDKLQAKLNSLDTNSSVIKVKELQTAINNLGSNDSGIVRLQNSITKLQERIANIKKNKIDVIDTSEINELKMAESEVTNLKNMLSQLKAGDVIDGKKITSSINQATNSVRTLESEFRNVNTTASGLATTMKSIFSYAIGGSVIYAAMNSIREAVNITIELNSAMTNLKKVTDETSETYTSFLNNMHNVALELGTQSNAMVDATTNWAKTGKNLQEAAELAENTVLLTKVGDVDNVDTAQTYMLPALQAFNIEAEKSITLIDKYNNISNNMATTVNDVGDAMSKSASSMSVAGNSLEQTIALIATAESQTKLGGAEVGTALKTLSMRLATFKDTETGEVIPQMTEKIKELTNVDITDLNGQLKNTYDIYTEIGKVYKDLDQNTQMQLNEILGGKLRGNIVSAILSHVSELQRAYDLANNSAGSAMNEFEKYQDSIQYSVDRLKEQINGLYTSFIGSDFLKSLTEGTASTIGAIQNIINTFGVMPTTITAVVGALTIFNAKFRESVTTMTSFVPGVATVQNNLKIFEQNLAKQSTQLKSNINNIKAYNNSTTQIGPPVANAGKQLLGLNAKLVATQTGLIATKVAVITLNAAMSMALTMGISAIISGLGSLIDKLILTRSELNELNQEFITTNSNSEMSNVIDLVNTYEELEDKLSTLSKGTSEYQAVEEKLASTQESILSVYPSASKAIEYNTEAKRLNLEATKKLIDKDLELAKADALDILEKNDTKTDTGLDKAIEQYQEYYKVLEKVNDLAEKEETKSVNIESKLSDSGELLVNAKDVDVYKKRVESLNDTLEASYEAYKILGVSNDKYAEKAKKVGEALGYSASQTEELIDKLKETDESADETAEALEDINGDGIIDATDQMLKLAMATDEAKSAVENLADSFSGLQDGIELLKQMKEEYSEYGMLDTDTMTKVLNSGDNQLIALLGDEANFIENINSLLDEKSKAQDEVLKTAIAMAQAEVNGSQEVVDATNAEISAVENLANAKENISSNSIQKRANMESILADNNAKNYATDESNYVNKENYKIKGSFDSANERMRAEKETVDNNSQNYGTDDKNYLALALSKIQNGDSVATAAIDATKQMVDKNNVNYAKDSQNHTNYINALINNYRTLSKAQNGGFTMGTLGFKEESKMLIDEMNNRKNAVESATKEMQNAVNTYNGVSGVGGGVSHGNIGSGSSGNKGSSGSSSSSKEVEDMESLVDRYHDLEDAINDVNNELETNKILQDGATGQQKIKLMEKEIQLYKKQQQAIKNLIAEQKKEAQELKNSLSSQGVNFNSAGDISNYNQILTSKVNWANSLSGDAKEKAIEQVKELEATMKSYDELVNKTIPSQEQEWESLNNTIKDVYKTQAELIADMEKNISETIEYELKKRYDAKKEALNKEKELYNKEYEEANFEEEMNTERNKLAEIQAEIDKVKNDTSRAGQLRLKQLLEEYEDQQKVINDKIKEQQNQAINDRFDEEEALLDKELEDMTSTENLSQMVAEAISTGMIKIGEETINVQNSMNDMLKETEVGFANVALQQSEWLSNLEQIKTLYSSINSIMGNAGMTTPSYDNISRSRSIGDINVTTGGITITGNADSSTLGSIQDMLDAQVKEIYKNIVKKLS